MPTPDPDLVEELAAVERARQGDHDAFVRLYRQDAPPAWRLALALTADPERAARAVADGFRRTLAPIRAAGQRSEAPFRLRVLTATRHAVIDGPAVDAPPLLTPGQGIDPAAARPAAVRAAQVMAAFHKLPERTRSILWLVAVEGLGTLEASRVLALRPSHAEELVDRATAALHEQWLLDRAADGDHDAGAPEHLERLLQPVMPLPMELFADTERSWSGSRTRPAGPLRLVLPGGHAVPRWAERTLVGTTAALIALGITSALAIDRDPDARDHRSSRTASADQPVGPSVDPGGQSGARDGGTSPGAMVTTEDDSIADTARPTTTLAERADELASAFVAASAASATPASATPGADPAAAPSSPTTTAPPVLQATVGLGPTLGVALGDQCTGLELAGTVAGCPPPTKDSGLTLDVKGSLLGS
jgi:DNA-directed RNA polymerase specialized sigma24 family protein